MKASHRVVGRGGWRRACLIMLAVPGALLGVAVFGGGADRTIDEDLPTDERVHDGTGGEDDRTSTGNRAEAVGDHANDHANDGANDGAVQGPGAGAGADTSADVQVGAGQTGNDTDQRGLADEGDVSDSLDEGVPRGGDPGDGRVGNGEPGAVLDTVS